MFRSRLAWTLVGALVLGCTPSPPAAARSTPTATSSLAAAEPETAAAADAPTWDVVSQHGIARVFATGHGAYFTLGDQLARLDGDTIVWDGCLSTFPEYVPEVLALIVGEHDELLARVSNGAQSSLWMRHAKGAATWQVIDDTFAERRTEIATARGPSGIVLMNRRFEVDSSVSFRALRLTGDAKPLSLQRHPHGCVNEGLYFWDLHVGDDDSTALLCAKGVERWASTTAKPELVALPEGVNLEELHGLTCPGGGVARPLRRLLARSGELTLLAPTADDEGTLLARRARNATTWDVQRLDGVAIAVAGTWLTSIAVTSDGCRTQLWRQVGDGYDKVGEPVDGVGRLLVDASDRPTVVGRKAIVSRNMDATVSESAMPEGEIDDAALVAGEVWLSSERGWISQHRYQERGEPGQTCQP